MIQKNCTKDRIKSLLYSQRFNLAAFFVPFVAMLIAFASVGIYPFGDRQIAVVDMYHQYIPFLSELQYKLQNGGNLFYSWNGAGGYNFWGLLAYYGASPLNLLLAVFPAAYIMEAVTLILMLKIGLAGLFMNMYLSTAYNKGSYLTVAFASMYALSSYVLGYYWCTMWIDVVALLPLCILGLYRLLKDGKVILYSLSLALALISNYYIGFMMCIFIAIYAPVLWLRTTRDFSLRSFMKAAGKTALYSLIGVGLSASMTLPAYFTIRNTYYSGSDLPEKWSLVNEPLRVLNQTLPYSELTHYAGAPNLYCGLIAVILLIFYFTVDSIRLREKVSSAILLGILFLSLTLNKVYLLWHGLHSPNCLPARFSFVVSFVLVCIAYQTILQMDRVKRKTIWSAFIALMAFLFIAYQIMPDAPDNAAAYIGMGIILLSIYTAVMAMYSMKRVHKGAFQRLIAGIICIEMILTSSFAVRLVGSQDRTAYFEKTSAMEDILSKLEGGFARTELMRHLSIIDAPAMYHYKGITQFSSTLNSNHSYMMKAIGVPSKPRGNRYDYVYASPITNAMLGIRYLISDKSYFGNENFKEKTQNATFALTENKYPLSVGYVLPEGAWDWETDYEDPCKSLNSFVKSVSDDKESELFTDLGEPSKTSSNIGIENQGDGHFKTSDGAGKEGLVTLEYALADDGEYYLCVDADSLKKATVSISDGSKLELDRNWGGAVYAGHGKKGDTLKIDFEYNKDKSGEIYCKLARFKDEEWEKIYKIMSSAQMEVSDYGDNYIKGSIHASNDGVFTTSVLYERGWKLYIDGEKIDTDNTVGNFIAADISKGDHIIELRYIPAGFIQGIMFTIEAAILLIILRRIFGKEQDAALESEKDEK